MPEAGLDVGGMFFPKDIADIEVIKGFALAISFFDNNTTRNSREKNRVGLIYGDIVVILYLIKSRSYKAIAFLIYMKYKKERYIWKNTNKDYGL